jgi:integrase
MASTYKRSNGQYRCVIRIKGVKPLTKSFDTKKEAQDWGLVTEATLNSRQVFGGNMTLAQILGRYLREVDSQKEYATVREGVLDGIPHVRGTVLPTLIKRFPNTEIKDMDRKWYIDNIGGMKRLSETGEPQGKLSAASRLRYMAALRAPLKEAKEWGVKVDWTAFNEAAEYLRGKRMIADGKGRTRRLQADEYTALKNYFNRPLTFWWTLRIPMADILDFALLTGLRETEITQIKFSDLNQSPKGPMLWIRNRKHPREKMGNDWNIPLLRNWQHPDLGSPEEIIRRQPRGEDRIFPFRGDSIGQAFSDACEALGIFDLHFHDLRHEAISRLFELGFDIPQVAKVSGHKDWTSLAIYTQLQSTDLHDGPAGMRRQETPTPAAPPRPALRLVK